MCRVMPYYVAKNFEYLEVLPKNGVVPHHPLLYVQRIKEKVQKMKEEYDIGY